MTAAGAAIRPRLGPAVRAALSAGALLLATGVPLFAQEWRVSAQFGRVDYAGAVADAAQTATLSLGASRLGNLDWLGASVGVPLRDDPLWAVAGVWKRWQTVGRAGLALDFMGHAFVQRDDEADSPLVPLPPAESTFTRSGEGVGGELAVVAFGSIGPARAELRAGATGQQSRVSDVESSTLLPFSEANVLLNVGVLQVGPEAKLWLADSTRSYVGLAAYGTAGPVDVWANGGGWVAGGPGEVAWSAGAALPVGGRVRLEGSFRSGSYDPLYDAYTNHSFTLGASVRVAGPGAGVVSAPTPARYEDGRAQIRIRATDVAGQPRIAGDFNAWQPQPMVAEGDDWTFTVPLAPGVYHYAFVDADGEWFVPEWLPGRRPDGMGGVVAVLVVP